MNKGFLKAGHLPTLFSAFLYFDMSFMVWVILGPLGVQIAKTLHLSPAEKGFMVAVPTLAAAALRIVNGVLVDHIGPRATGLIAQVLVMASLAAAWYFGIHSYQDVLLLGVGLGMAGASFAVALPLASRWYPPEHQGTALGIAGAGNSGTVLASLFAPSLAVAVGWNNVLGLAVLPLLVVFVVFFCLAKTAPNRPTPKSLAQYLNVLKIGDAWLFMALYAVSFGGFVGLSSSLTIYYNDMYGVGPVVAGFGTAACVFSGSLLRPVGGAIADRIGGLRTLTITYAIAAAAIVVVSFGMPSFITAILGFIAGMGALGMANGAVFQLVPQRFGREIGVMTGLVGAMGGVGGFYLASSLGLSKQWTHSYQAGLLIFAGLAIGALLLVTAVKRHWRANLAADPAAVRI